VSVRVVAVIAAVLVALVAPVHAEKVVAIAPLSTLGAEDTSASTKQLIASLEAAVAQIPDHRVIGSTAVVDAIKKAKKPQLRVCEGDNACLAELGKLVGAHYVIAGEVGGLGASAVVYLNLTEVATGKELKSTTLAVGAKDDRTGGASGAVIRLLDPARYTGYLKFAIDAQGATVYVNGTKATLSAQATVLLPVGPQAIRITHPQYVDFVRFIDVSYGKTTEVPVAMTQYRRIEHDVAGKPLNTDNVRYIDPPLWRRWYIVVPAAIVIGAFVTGIVAASVDDLPGVCRKVGGAEC